MPANRPDCAQAGQRSSIARENRIRIFSQVECLSGFPISGWIGRATFTTPWVWLLGRLDSRRLAEQHHDTTSVPGNRTSPLADLGTMLGSAANVTTQWTELNDAVTAERAPDAENLFYD